MKDWNGTFEAWSVDSATGSITHEQGTMQGGVLTGDYTCDVHTGEGALDVYSLWNNREGMEYITYTGSSPPKKSRKNCWREQIIRI